MEDTFGHWQVHPEQKLAKTRVKPYVLSLPGCPLHPSIFQGGILAVKPVSDF